MAQFNRWWDSLGKAERIVAISLGLSAPIAIINSTVWAIATMYIVRQKTRVEIERARAAYARAAALLEHEEEEEAAFPAR